MGTAWARHGHGMGTAWARHVHGMCTAWARHGHGMGTAWARHGHGMCLPLQAIGSSELNRKILRGSFILPEWLSSEAADLIHQMLTLSPERRITLEGIRAHPWLRGVAEAEKRLAAWKQAGGGGGGGGDGGGGGGGGGADAADVASPMPEGAAEEVDAAILRQVEQLGFNAEAVSQSVRAKAYDHGAALYHMLQRKAAVAKCRPAVVTAVLG
jgi:hypothetical protein